MDAEKQTEKKAAKPARKPAAKSSARSAAKTAPRRTKRRQEDVIFALDIGTRSVVGVLAEKMSDGGYRVIDMETAEHKKRSMIDGQIEDIEAVAEVIKSVKAALEKKNAIKLSRVCIAAAGRALRTMRGVSLADVGGEKTISDETLREAEMEAVRLTEERFHADNSGAAFYCVGHSVIGLKLDGYPVQKPEGHRGEKLETEIIAAFLPSYVVESLCTAVDYAGLDVAGLTLEPIAAMNVVVPPELRMINIALCDIGAGTSDVAVSDGGSVVAYGMATTAGDEITEALMKALLCDFQTAERIKTSPDEEITYTDILFSQQKITRGRLNEILLAPTKALAEVICGEILKANEKFPQAVFLVGGGSKLFRLAEFVAAGLSLDEARVAVGRRELLRGITAPKGIAIGTEHATPLGIAVTASSGIHYDFTTIMLNGRKIRALDTSRLTVFELTSLGGISPQKLMGRSGRSLSFMLFGEKITLRGTFAKNAEITVNGKPAALNTAVRKGDEVVIIPAENGEDAAAFLSDYIAEKMYIAKIIAFGEEMNAGRFAVINGKETVSDCEIAEGDDISLSECVTLSELCLQRELSLEDVLLNGKFCGGDTVLTEGDVIELYEAPQAAEEPESFGIPISINGMETVFPLPKNSSAPIFLDVLAFFTDNPTEFLANSPIIRINGKIARLDEEIHGGDVIEM